MERDKIDLTNFTMYSGDELRDALYNTRSYIFELIDMLPKDTELLLSELSNAIFPLSYLIDNTDFTDKNKK